jgi:hypothetical protein
VRNELIRVAGEKFGFSTAEVYGVRSMLAADLAQRLYRHSDTSALVKLLGRDNKPLMSLRSVGHSVQHFFNKELVAPVWGKTVQRSGVSPRVSVTVDTTSFAYPEGVEQ